MSNFMLRDRSIDFVNKRKAKNELSQNINTLRNRKRIQRMSEYEQSVKNVKRVDFVNEIYYIQKLKSFNV